MKFKDLHRNVKFRLIESFLTSLLGYMILPFISIYFSKVFGVTITGILMVINIFIGLIAGFYGGYLSDHLGRRKIMLIAECFRLIGFLSLAFCNSPWFESGTLTYLMMLLVSIGSGMSLPAAEAMVIDVSVPANRKFIYGIEYWSINVALAVGGVLGGLLFMNFRFELFIAGTFISIISLSIISLFISETYYPNNDSNDRFNNTLKEIFINYMPVLKDTSFLFYIIASILTLSVEFQVKNYIGIRLSQELSKVSLIPFMHIDVNGIKLFGFLQSENACLVIILSLFLSRITNKYSDRGILIIGIILYSLSYFIIAIESIPWALFTAMFFATMGELMYWPIKQKYLADITPPHNRSSYMAVNSLVGRGATILGSFAITLGAFFPSWFMGTIFFSTGMVGMLIFLIIFPKINIHKRLDKVNQV